jgi:hypothetical protein
VSSLPYYAARLEHHRSELAACTEQFAAAQDPIAKSMLAGAMAHEADQVSLYSGVVRAMSADFPFVEHVRAA